MARITVILCFMLTLLCPVFCLAKSGGDCSAHDQPMSENCEAMTFGAKLEKPETGIPSEHQLLPCAHGLCLPEMVTVDSYGGLHSIVHISRNAKPPPDGPRRHALLQTFLF
jgi:hypothetical protein